MRASGKIVVVLDLKGPKKVQPERNERVALFWRLYSPTRTLPGETNDEPV